MAAAAPEEPKWEGGVLLFCGGTDFAQVRAQLARIFGHPEQIVKPQVAWMLTVEVTRERYLRKLTFRNLAALIEAGTTSRSPANRCAGASMGKLPFRCS